MSKRAAYQREWKQRPDVVARYHSSEFKAKARERQRRYLARPEVRERRRAWRLTWEAKPGVKDRLRSRERNRSPRPDSQRRNWELAKRYSLTLEQFVALLARQDNRCALCRSENPGRRGSFSVDHDHKTGAIRGLLCNHCNTGLGHFRDDPNLLVKASSYILGGGVV